MDIHHIVALAFISILTLISVGVHYEVLSFCSRYLGRRERKRFHVLIAVFSGLFAHVFEVLIFALAWYVIIINGWTHLSNSNSFVDIIYFSFSTFTTIGYGDIVPVGACKILAGYQGLIGLVLITWTTSFTYFIMKQCWK